MYMEYCQGGDLEAKFQKMFNSSWGPARGDVPEEYVWRLIKCIGHALNILRAGPM